MPPAERSQFMSQLRDREPATPVPTTPKTQNAPSGREFICDTCVNDGMIGERHEAERRQKEAERRLAQQAAARAEAEAAAEAAAMREAKARQQAEQRSVFQQHQTEVEQRRAQERAESERDARAIAERTERARAAHEEAERRRHEYRESTRESYKAFLKSKESQSREPETYATSPAIRGEEIDPAVQKQRQLSYREELRRQMAEKQKRMQANGAEDAKMMAIQEARTAAVRAKGEAARKAMADEAARTRQSWESDIRAKRQHEAAERAASLRADQIAAERALEQENFAREQQHAKAVHDRDNLNRTLADQIAMRDARKRDEAEIEAMKMHRTPTAARAHPPGCQCAVCGKRGPLDSMGTVPVDSPLLARR